MQSFWVIWGRSPVRWTMPVHVTWDGNEATVFPLIAPLPAYIEAAYKDRMMEFSIVLERGMWRLSRLRLLEIGYERTGNPDEHFSWALPHPATNPALKENVNPDREEFIDALHLAGVGRTRDEVAWWWATFCNHALDWMWNKRKPVNLYAFNLHLLPYRMNWRLALHAKHRELAATIWKKRRENQMSNSVGKDFLKDLSSTRLLAMHRGKGYVYQHVDVEHLGAWWKLNIRVERRRRKQLGFCGYLSYITDCVRRAIPVATRIYLAYLQNMGRPSAQLAHRNYAGGRGLEQVSFRRYTKEGGKSTRDKNLISDKTMANLGSNLYRRFRRHHVGFNVSEKVSCPDEPLPTMPDLQPEAQDLRNGGAHLPDSGGQP